MEHCVSFGMQKFIGSWNSHYKNDHKKDPLQIFTLPKLDKKGIDIDKNKPSIGRTTKLHTNYEHICINYILLYTVIFVTL